MCGIAGIFKSDGAFSPGDVAAVLRMIDAQEHRGPDDWGILVPDSLLRQHEVDRLLAPRGLDHVGVYHTEPGSPAVILGSTRLSILDLSPHGHMPMGDGLTWVTHNGEIYNCRELREELKAAQAEFQSTGDTEVIIKGYERWGDDVLHHLRGMFALAIFDAGEKRLLLARDRFGIKPLYYYREKSESQTVVFASEVRAIVSSGLVPDVAEPEAAVRFLQLGSVPAPLTTIKDVFALPAGHTLSADNRGVAINRYWSLSTASSTVYESEQQVVARTAELLDESVRQHLLSDVPLGIFLSGGIDSSALVAVAQKYRTQPLTTLSIVFDEVGYNEGYFSRLVAGRYHTDHRETRLTSEELRAEFPDVFAAMDQPTVDGVNSYFISRAAKQAGLKVVLSGLGGDELFLGYSHFKKARSLSSPMRWWQKLPGGVRRGAVSLAQQGGKMAGRSGSEKLSYLQDASAANLYLMFRGLFTLNQIQKLLGLSSAEMKRYGAHPATVNGAGESSLVNSFVVNEFQHYLQDQLLKDTDCMSMAHSIETRVPFLDHELVQYVFGAPERFKFDGAMTKPLLLKALGEDFPREVWDRPKMGFTFPFAPWLRNQMAEFQPYTTNSIINKTEAEKIRQGFQQGAVHWSRPWALMVLEQWKSVGL
jgi:asparagine synthase (glutamine-hydrolysing)